MRCAARNLPLTKKRHPAGRTGCGGWEVLPAQAPSNDGGPAGERAAARPGEKWWLPGSDPGQPPMMTPQLLQT